MAGSLKNGKRQAFIRFYCTGPEGIRGNGTECYKVVYPGVSHETAETNASKLLRDTQLIADVRAFHAKATAEAIAQLADWKTLAPIGQATMQHLAQGNIRHIDPITGERTFIRMDTKDNAAVARVMMEAARELVERAYPKSLRIITENAPAELAAIVGATPDELPPAGEVSDEEAGDT